MVCRIKPVSFQNDTVFRIFRGVKRSPSSSDKQHFNAMEDGMSKTLDQGFRGGRGSRWGRKNEWSWLRAWRKTCRVLAVVGLCAGGGLSLAETPYMGAGLGHGRLDLDCIGASECSKGDAAGRIYGGYQWGNGWGLELGFQRFARATATVGDTRHEFTAEGFTLAGTYRLDFNPQWWGAARLGAVNMELKRAQTSPAAKVSSTDTSTQPLWGLDVGYRIDRQISVSASADFSRAKAAGDTRNLSLWLIGMRYDF
jgi:hypothetical protein